MNRVILENEYELACDMLSDYAKTDEFGTVGCVGFYDQIKDLATALIAITQGEIKLANVELKSEDCNGYNKEYVLTLDVDGLWIQEMKWEGHEDYISLEEDFIYIYEECNSKIIKGIDEKSEITSFCYSYELEDDEEECDGDCCNCSCCNEDTEFELDNDEDQHGFSFTKTDKYGTSSCSFYSTDIDLVEEMRKEIIESF